MDPCITEASLPKKLSGPCSFKIEERIASALLPEIGRINASGNTSMGKLSILNKIIIEALAMNPPSTKKGKKLRVLYATQIKTAPPTFILFVNNEDLVQDSYKRYLENKMREAFGFTGTPIRLSFRERKEKQQ